jgi:hypothetical protein
MFYFLKKNRVAVPMQKKSVLFVLTGSIGQPVWRNLCRPARCLMRLSRKKAQRFLIYRQGFDGYVGGVVRKPITIQLTIQPGEAQAS